MFVLQQCYQYVCNSWGHSYPKRQHYLRWTTGGFCHQSIWTFPFGEKSDFSKLTYQNSTSLNQDVVISRQFVLETKSMLVLLKCNSKLICIIKQFRPFRKYTLSSLSLSHLFHMIRYCIFNNPKLLFSWLEQKQISPKHVCNWASSVPVAFGSLKMEQAKKCSVNHSVCEGRVTYLRSCHLSATRISNSPRLRASLHFSVVSYNLVSCAHSSLSPVNLKSSEMGLWGNGKLTTWSSKMSIVVFLASQSECLH